MNFVVNHNSWTLKSDNFSFFQNVISNNPPPSRVIIMHCIRKSICDSHLALNKHFADASKMRQKNTISTMLARYGLGISYSLLISYLKDRGVFKKSCSENMQQIYRRTLMPKYDFNKIKSNFIEIALRYRSSPVNLLPSSDTFS